MSKLREELKTLQMRTVTAERNRVWIYMQLVDDTEQAILAQINEILKETEQIYGYDTELEVTDVTGAIRERLGLV